MPMDVNFTSSSGTQMPLANIVESGNGYIRFENGIQIVYDSARQNAVVSDDVFLYGHIIYPKPFIGSRTVVFGKNELILYKSSSFGTPKKYMAYDDSHIQIIYGIFNYQGNEIDSTKGFRVRVTSEQSLIAEMNVGTFHIDYIAIGRWK